MSEKVYIPCKILDKVKSKGIFGRDKRKFIIEILENNINMPKDIKMDRRTLETEVSLDDYYHYNIGDELQACWYVHDDGKLYNYE